MSLSRSKQKRSRGNFLVKKSAKLSPVGTHDTMSFLCSTRSFILNHFVSIKRVLTSSEEAGEEVSATTLFPHINFKVEAVKLSRRRMSAGSSRIKLASDNVMEFTLRYLKQWMPRSRPILASGSYH